MKERFRRQIILGAPVTLLVPGCLADPNSSENGPHLSISNHSEEEKTIQTVVETNNEKYFDKSVTLPPAESKGFENITNKILEAEVTVSTESGGQRTTIWETNPSSMLEIIIEDDGIKFEISTA